MQLPLRLNIHSNVVQIQAFVCLPIFNKTVSGLSVHIWVKSGHTAAHEHPESRVMSNSDWGLDADGLAEVKHINPTLMLPVVCTEIRVVSIK